MNIIDLTHSLSVKTGVHPKKRRFSRRTRISHNKGLFVEDFQFSSGVGTHLIAPLHALKGEKGIDKVLLSQCMAPACTIHFKEKVNGKEDYLITEEDLVEWEEANGIIPEESIVLLHTGWDALTYTEKFAGKGHPRYPGISSKAAELFVDRKVKGVGIDTPGIDPGQKSEPKALMILSKKALIVGVGLNHLEKLPPVGSYVFFMPIKIENAPEAPMRAIALVP